MTEEFFKMCCRWILITMTKKQYSQFSAGVIKRSFLVIKREGKKLKEKELRHKRLSELQSFGK